MRFFALFLFIFPLCISAQGFQSMNGRNHPELKWVEAETEHFKLIYPTHLAGIENRVAPIVEESWQALSKNIGFEPKGKFRLYLSDEDEIANGSTYSLGESFMNVWVNVNSVAEIWTGNEKWLRKVISHELAHAFHFRSIQTPFAKLFPIFAPNTTPRSWMEGFAQYQTEVWDSERGDRDLRLAILEDNLSLGNENSFYNGGLLYAAGNSQVRYFVSQYGDSTLTKLLSYKDKKTWLYDFEIAFQKSTNGISFNKFLQNWKKAMYRQYNAQAYQMENIETTKMKALPFPSGMILSAKLSPNQENYAILYTESPQRPIKRLILQRNDSTKTRIILAEGNIQAPIQWKKDGSKLLYSRIHRGRNGSLINDIFEYDIATKSEKQITQTRRASYPVYWTANDGNQEIAYIASINGTSNLFYVENGKEKQLTDYNGDVQIYGLTSHSDRFVMSVWQADGKRELVFIGRNPLDAPLSLAKPEGADFRQPEFNQMADNLAYISLEDNVPNVFIYQNGFEQRKRLTNFSNGAEILGWKGADSLIVKIPERLYTDKVYVIGINRESVSTNVITEDWQTHKPAHWIGNDFTPNGALIQSRKKYNSLKNLTHVYTLPLAATGIGAQSLWIEPLGKHTVTGVAFLGIQRLSDSFLQLGYINRQLKPTIYSTLFYYPTTKRTYNATSYTESQSGFSGQAIFPLDRLQKPYTLNFLRFTTAQTYHRNKSDSLTQTLTPPNALHLSMGTSFLRKYAQPDVEALFLPKRGYGVNIGYRLGRRKADSSRRLDVAGYYIQPVFKQMNAYGYTRFLRHKGTGLLKNTVGTTQFAPIDINQFYTNLTGLGLVFLDDYEKVRGYQTSITGHQMAFGTLEMRMPFADLQTKIFGLDISKTALSVLADGAVIWQDNRQVKQLGLGVELRNQIKFGGFSLIHAVGFAQPYDQLGYKENVGWRNQGDFYWRLKAAIPF